MEKRIISHLEKVMKSQTDALYSKIEKEAKARAQKEKEEQKKMIDQMATKVASILEDRLAEKLSKTCGDAIHKDMPKEIGNAVKNHLPVALDVHTRSDTNKATIEKHLAPVIEKNMKSGADKTIAGMKPAMAETFRSTFATTLIPAFEGSCGKMFEQINATFERGMTERMEVERQQSAAVAKMQQLSVVAEELSQKLASLQTHAQAAAAAPAAAVGTPSAAQAAMPSPAKQALNPDQERQQAEQLRQLLQQEKYEEAFSKVLHLENLKWVTWICQCVDSRHVFSKRPPVLTSPVVLALVHQLGFDMTTDAQLKITWLRDAVMALNAKDPLIEGHVPTVLRDLHTKLAAMERAGTGEFPVVAENDFRILMMVIKSDFGVQ
mmetsp:Transcript_1943/g.3102  ORF Transcript_1943/g.3102 Transcript_1943/m.3102 type:complete len:379 (-) Transcript_1943:103-1239(-)